MGQDMRVPKVKLRQVPWRYRLLFWWQKRKYGRVLDSSLVWVRVPGLFSAVARLYGRLDRRSSPLPPELRLMVIVRVSQINRCQFCIDLNTSRLMRVMKSNKKVLELTSWHESELFSKKERAVLDYVEKITDSNLDVDDHCFEQLKIFFDDKSLIEITALIAFQNMSTKFNEALRIPSQGFLESE